MSLRALVWRLIRARAKLGLNTLLLSASNTPVPDIVALGATAGNSN